VLLQDDARKTKASGKQLLQVFKLLAATMAQVCKSMWWGHALVHEPAWFPQRMLSAFLDGA
jgi:hypothetical protein